MLWDETYCPECGNSLRDCTCPECAGCGLPTQECECGEEPSALDKAAYDYYHGENYEG